MADFSVVGKGVPRVDSLEKVTGKAEFPITFRLPHMLHGKVVRSPHPHARIISIDTSKAERLPGVKVVVTAKNTPRIRLGALYRDRDAFPPDLTVRYVGDAVAAVAAETEDIAEEAAVLVKVKYEELPAVFDTEEAFRTDPPAVVHPELANYECRFERMGIRRRLDPERPNVCDHFKVRQGDVGKGFQEADLIVENRYFTPRIQHCQLEPCASVAWFESDGTLRLVTTGQGAHVTQAEIGEAFNLPPSKVRVECHYLGGAFGGKGRNITEPYAVLLSMKAGGRPVRVCFTRDEHFVCGRSRVPVVTYIKDGVKRDGTIVARELRILVDMGAYADSAIMIVRACAFGPMGIYKTANFKLDSYGVYTNTPMSAPFRGFGNAETLWAVENQMDMIAEKLGLDAVEVRKRNFLKDGERYAFGQIVRSIGIEECLDKAQKWIEWDKKPVQEGSWKRGKGIALGCKGTQTGFPSSALVKVHPDGSVEVRHSSQEIGMGVDTVVAQIAAESFGISMDSVRVVSGDTATCPYGYAPVSSRETFHMGNAVLAACEDAKRELFEVASPKLGVPIELLETRDRKVCVKGQPGKEVRIPLLFRPPGVGYALAKCEIIGKSTFEVPLIPEDPETGQSERQVSSYGYGAQAVEVAVDVETGEVRVLRSVGCFDGGTAINPKMCETQIEGGVGMGIGAALYEELLISEKGETLNPNFRDYKIPTAEDMPNNANVVAMLAPAPHPEGPFGAKGLGEQVMIPYAPAVSNAIYNAVGVRIKELPITPDKILKALKEKKKHFHISQLGKGSS